MINDLEGRTQSRRIGDALRGPGFQPLITERERGRRQ
jgi:hypothetical protein